ncbi:helix-turn-helix transcriptional regulator [Streptoalloteichus hindustanus]|uniref:AraC-type DNA-binding protein n=1 Tax=Streptoalloteichus hindustanus TaxID=2017 RepID=A0A1M4UMS6_STRHI|nr:helix-turn-helix domain-containing protein [Streptoalloteichus hindustanus]SHE57965.1 AraC-type DNA-binding protein [Streptoalloteichus hindustanus]
MFRETGPAEVPGHSHPVWKLVLPERGGGLLVPPGLRHSCAASSAFTAVFVDPWCTGMPPGGRVSHVDARSVRRLLDALGEDMDLVALRGELSTVLGPAPTVDPRIAHALRECGRADRLDGLAARVGLSPSRLRALAREAAGIPLSRLRQWRRLRWAVRLLPHKPTAEVAALAGFADQAHLTRTARRLVGRTPGSLRPQRPQSPCR